MKVKPSMCTRWDRVVKEKANTDGTGGHPERYHWYLDNGKYYAHRIATIDEIINDEFN